MNKATIPLKKKKNNDKVDVRKIAYTIELTLESFGITVRVAEINENENDIDFNLDVALGTPIEGIAKLHKDIAMAIASPTGDVEVLAPIPGRSMVGIKVPLGKFANTNKTGKYKVIRIEKERIIIKGLLPQLKYLFIDFLRLISKLINKLIDYLN